MKEIVNTFLKGIAETQQFLHQPMPLQAMWLTYKTFLIDDGHVKHTCRIAVGNKVRVNNGVIIDCHKEEGATHEVKVVFGTVDRLEYFELENLINNQLERITL